MEEAAMSGFCMRAAGTVYRGCGNPNSSSSNNNNNNKGSGSCSSGSKCGRWNPTAEQVKLLTQLFSSGLRTPTTDQIQKISSHLSFYGHIESKNVFYWFQNHKARERQKRRKLSSHDTNPPALPPHNNKPSQKKVMNQATEPERVIETLQLFPLNSFGESDDQTENKLRVHANCRDDHTMFIPHTHHQVQEEQMEHPPLDLRLSFL